MWCWLCYCQNTHSLASRPTQTKNLVRVVYKKAKNGDKDDTQSDQEGSDTNVFVPTKEVILKCFVKNPGDCSVEEIASVRFFYNVALATVQKKIRN